MPLPTPQDILYMKEHIHDDRAPEMRAAFGVNFTLACIAVIFRFLARYISRSRVMADDWNVVAALVVVTAQLIVNVIGVNLGAGKHVILLKKPIPFAKIVLASEIFYIVGTMFVKFSVLCLYKRLFGSNRRFRILLWAIGAFVLAHAMASALPLPFQCHPIKALWNPYIPGKCTNTALAAVIVGAINVVLDFLILSLPIPMVWRLKMKNKWKLQLVGIFLLGGFVCVGSIVRLTTLHKLSLVDATWNDVDSAIWAFVENCIGIVSACLPTLRPLFNVIANGHHCSASNGYCPHCSQKSGIGTFGSGWRSSRFRSEKSNNSGNHNKPEGSAGSVLGPNSPSSRPGGHHDPESGLALPQQVTYGGRKAIISTLPSGATTGSPTTGGGRGGDKKETYFHMPATSPAASSSEEEEDKFVGLHDLGTEQRVFEMMEQARR